MSNTFKYLDFVDPAYVENEKAAQTSNAITHHVAIIAHVRQNWTPNWYGAIFFDERCQVNSIAISCFQAFTCPSPNKCRKSEDIISIKTSMIHDCRMPNLEPALDASHDEMLRENCLHLYKPRKCVFKTRYSVAPSKVLHSMPAQCVFMYLHPD